MQRDGSEISLVSEFGENICIDANLQDIRFLFDREAVAFDEENESDSDGEVNYDDDYDNRFVNPVETARSFEFWQ